MAAPAKHNVASLAERVGHDFGLSQPVLVDQARIDSFARCTGDHQWIHVDVERSRQERGGTIAHGLLTLSLIPAIQFELGVYPSDARSVLNYGFEKVRFLAPVPAGSQIVVQAELVAVEPKGSGRQLMRVRNTAYLDGGDERTVLVAETLALVTA